MAKEVKEKKKEISVRKLYEGGKVKNKFCPKCGPGVFMAVHKDRETCGKCGYTVFKSHEKK